jgi:hypothetical protein
MIASRGLAGHARAPARGSPGNSGVRHVPSAARSGGDNRSLPRTLVAVCFSPQADLIGGTVVAGLGVDALVHVHRRHDQVALAVLPLLLGLHQIDEAIVWFGLQGHVSPAVGRVALWIFLLIAFVVLPIYVPVAVLLLEPTRSRRLRIAPFAILGAGVAAVLLAAMVRGPIGVRLAPYHLAYSLRLGDGLAVITLYVLAVTGSLLLSGYRHVFAFGLANLIAVSLLAWLLIDGFASLWCAWAAVTAFAIAAHMRFAKPHRATPYVLT